MGAQPLSAYTSFGIGGEAELVFLTCKQQIYEALSGGCVILGRGTNVLASDRGVRETVVVNKLNVATFEGETVYAESGVSLISLCAMCAERCLSGLEWACGIPGSVGGAVVMNAGAYGGCIADRLIYADVFRDGRLIRLEKDDLCFSYRKSGLKNGDFVAGAAFGLKRDAQEKIISAMRALQLKRGQSQPGGRSAGSVYMRGDRPAGWYIEAAGLKGAREGGAVVSEKHANFIINTGGATAADVVKLMTRIEEKVKELFNVELKREIQLIGEF